MNVNSGQMMCSEMAVDILSAVSDEVPQVCFPARRNHKIVDCSTSIQANDTKVGSTERAQAGLSIGEVRVEFGQPIRAKSRSMLQKCRYLRGSITRPI
jgi:hypothetical protein